MKAKIAIAITVITCGILLSIMNDVNPNLHPLSGLGIAIISALIGIGFCGGIFEINDGE